MFILLMKKFLSFLISQIKVQLWKKQLLTDTHTQNIYYTTIIPKCYNKNGMNFNTNVQHDYKCQSGWNEKLKKV